MNPIAVQIGSFTIYWYGILVATAFIIGFLMTRHNIYTNIPGAKSRQEAIDGMLLILSIALFVGARLGVVLVNLDHYIANPVDVFARGGLGSQGAILTVMVLGVYYTRKNRVPYWSVADAVAPGLSLGHIAVRIGNYLNGELFGTPTDGPWGVVFPGSGVPVHPVQLYEAGLALLVLPFAILWARKPAYPGYAFIRILLYHSFTRFILDFFRQQFADKYAGLYLTQIIALVMVIGLSALLIYLEWKRRVDPTGIQPS